MTRHRVQTVHTGMLVCACACARLQPPSRMRMPSAKSAGTQMHGHLVIAQQAGLPGKEKLALGPQDLKLRAVPASKTTALHGTAQSARAAPPSSCLPVCLAMTGVVQKCCIFKSNPSYGSSSLNSALLSSTQLPARQGVVGLMPLRAAMAAGGTTFAGLDLLFGPPEPADCVNTAVTAHRVKQARHHVSLRDSFQQSASLAHVPGHAHDHMLHSRS